MLKNTLELKKVKLSKLADSYVLTRFSDILDARRQNVDILLNDAVASLKEIISTKKSQFGKATAKLDALSPLKVLARGYSIIEDDAGKIITSTADAKPDTEFTLRLSDGTARGKFI